MNIMRAFRFPTTIKLRIFQFGPDIDFKQIWPNFTWPSLKHMLDGGGFHVVLIKPLGKKSSFLVPNIKKNVTHHKSVNSMFLLSRSKPQQHNKKRPCTSGHHFREMKLMTCLRPLPYALSFIVILSTVLNLLIFDGFRLGDGKWWAYQVYRNITHKKIQTYLRLFFLININSENQLPWNFQVTWITNIFWCTWKIALKWWN